MVGGTQFRSVRFDELVTFRCDSHTVEVIEECLGKYAHLFEDRSHFLRCAVAITKIYLGYKERSLDDAMALSVKELSSKS